MPPAPAPASTFAQVSRLQAFLGGQQAPQPPQPPPRPPTGSGAPQVICSLRMFPKLEYNFTSTSFKASHFTSNIPDTFEIFIMLDIQLLESPIPTTPTPTTTSQKA